MGCCHYDQNHQKYEGHGSYDRNHQKNIWDAIAITEVT